MPRRHLVVSVEKLLAIRQRDGPPAGQAATRSGLDSLARVALAIRPGGRDRLAGEIVPIKHALATAVQPFAVSKTCKYPQLIGRLLDAITTLESRQKFESLKFEWRADSPKN